MKILYLYLILLITATVFHCEKTAAQDSRFKTENVGKKQSDKLALNADSLLNRPHPQSKLFRDSLPISRVAALSIIVPGFSQVYNAQYWKIPVLYGSVGALATLGFKANSNFKSAKQKYDIAEYNGAEQAVLDHLKAQKIKYNNQRTLLIGGAALCYLYFIGDGVLNYPNYATGVKKATTLSMIFPGAGQIYNGSYWKLPIIYGGFATMGYIIDFNNRGYQRFKKAYNLNTDGDANTVDEFKGRYSSDVLKNTRDAYRRNRDLSIIITCGFYLLNVIDAHVDAHMRTYDISDELAMRVEPTLMELQTTRNGRTQGMGLAMSFRF